VTGPIHASYVVSDRQGTLAAVLIEGLDDEALARLAERLRPYLSDRHVSADEGWLRGADAIAAYIGSPSSRVYALNSCKPSRIPVHRDGSALIAKRSELDAWLEQGGGLRP
jgi:hypothetical protein